MKNIFIGGCGRSGTSFFQKVLTSHSQIKGGPEFDFIHPLLSIYKRMTSDFHLDRQKYFYNKAELDFAFKSFLNKCLSDKYKDDCIYFSEKTPNNIDVAKDLLVLFPDAYFINIMRDGRDVLASHNDVAKRMMLKNMMNKKEAFSTYHVSNLWNNAIDSYFNLMQNEDVNSRVINVRYEELLMSPEKVLSSVMKSLGLSIEPQMLKPGELKVSTDKVITDGIWALKEMENAHFDVTKIGRWKAHLNYFEKRKAEKIMRLNLQKLQYL